MGNLKAVRLGSALAGFGALFLLGAWVYMRVMMIVDAGWSGSDLTRPVLVAAAFMFPAVVLAVMTVRPAWALEKAGPTTKYKFPAVLALLWLFSALFWVNILA